MRLSLHTDYALRLLMMLAVEPNQTLTVEEVAGRYDISRNHLNKVVQTLVRAGFVDSQRGRGGGVRLAVAPEDINLGRVVRATEDNFEIVECFHGPTNTCVLAPVCGLRDPLQQAVGAFLAVLDRQSLADLLRNPSAARRIRRVLSA